MELCYQYKGSRARDEEAFVFDDSATDRRKVRLTSPITSNGRLLVTGDDVTQVLSNVLEDTFNPGADRVLEELIQPGVKSEFSPANRSDYLEDDRFLSAEKLDQLIGG